MVEHLPDVQVTVVRFRWLLPHADVAQSRQRQHVESVSSVGSIPTVCTNLT